MIDVAALRSAPPRPRRRRRARPLRGRGRPVPRGRDRRRRVPRLPAEPGRLRAAPGRPQPDAAGEGAPRARHPGPARHVRPHRRRVLARLGPPHDPPERPVPLRASSSGSAPRCATSPRPASPAGRRAATRCATSPAAISPGRARYEVLDITPWAAGDDRPVPAQPARAAPAPQVQDQLLGLRHRLRPGDVQRRRRHRRSPSPARDGTVEAGFRVFFAGGLGANPHPAQALEEFTAREDLLPTIEAILRVQDHYGNRDNKLRARMKWLVDTMGVEELRERIIKERRFLIASATYPGGMPAPVVAARRRAGGHGDHAPTSRHAGRAERRRPVPGVGGGERRPRPAPTGRSSAYAHCRLGDITSDQFRGLADLQRELGSDVRITNRQNLVFRDLTEAQLPRLYDRLADLRWPTPGAELARDVVACPGADTCNLAVTQSRGLADDIDRALEDAGLADVGGVRVNISGCTNSCGQHHISDIGFFGLERRAHGRAAPGYQMLLGGHVGEMADRVRQQGRRSCRPRPRRRRWCASSAATPTSAAPARRSGLARPVGRRGDGRRAACATSTTFPDPDEAPTSTSTSTRPARTSGRGRRRGVRHVTRRTTDDRELPDLRELAAASAAPRTPACDLGDRVGRRALRRRARARLVVPGLRAHRPRRPGRRPTSRSCSSTPSTTSPRRCWYVDTVRRRYDLQPARSSSRRSSPTTAGWTTPTRAARPARSCRWPRRSPGATGVDDRAAPRRGPDPGARPPIVGYDVGRGMVKVNPIATWTEADVGPLRRRTAPCPSTRCARRATPSIGCWPCTRPVADGEDPRAGRWAGLDKLKNAGSTR